MKKSVSLILVLIMCLSLVACTGGSSGDGKESIYLKETEDGSYDIVCPNPEVLGECVEKIEITKDNWHEYFEDYEYTEHIVKKNDFGDIEEEYDAVYLGFGVKRGLIACVDKVSFKFDGMTEYSNYDFDKLNADKVEYNVYTANEAAYNAYNYVTDEIIEEKQLSDDEVEDHYLLELKYSEEEDGIHFGEHNCIDAIGVLYVITLPEGVYNGEELSQIEWENGGGASICVSNLERYCGE